MCHMAFVAWHISSPPPLQFLYEYHRETRINKSSKTLAISFCETWQFCILSTLV